MGQIIADTTDETVEELTHNSGDDLDVGVEFIDEPDDEMELEPDETPVWADDWNEEDEDE